MTPRDWLVLLLLLAGAALMLLAALGIVRMPDLYMRMSAASKAGTLGAGLTMAAVATSFGTAAVATRAVAIVAFLVLTIPVASHAIGRAAYHVGVPLWRHTRSDALREALDAEQGLRRAHDPLDDRSE